MKQFRIAGLWFLLIILELISTFRNMDDQYCFGNGCFIIGLLVGQFEQVVLPAIRSLKKPSADPVD